MQVFKRRGCAVSRSQRKPKPKPVWWRPPEEEILVPICIPDNEDLREVLHKVLCGSSCSTAPFLVEGNLV